MNQAAIETLIGRAIGLDISTVGASVIHYALRQRMTARRTTELADYWALVTSSREELQELINAVVVPETWFFRDRAAFAAMTGHVRANRRAGQPIAILSLPCSTGEEPYSIVMAMLDAGFAPADFRVDAIDVSTRNLVEAERAIYGRNSFRGADLAFRDRYFEPVDGGFRPGGAVRERVRFQLGNIFDPASTSSGAPYDAIFCRNLLIYFDREMQERALDRLRQALAPAGLLLVGPAESSLPSLFGFVSNRQSMAFAFLKRPQTIPAENTEPLKKPRARPTPAPRAPAVRTAAPRKPATAAPRPAAIVSSAAAAAPSAGAESSLSAIERAANAGRLAEAKQAAAIHLNAFGPSAPLFYLLGLAHDAGEEIAEAARNYRKALYLAPDHRETLAHLALLLQRQGDVAGAKALRGRLGRIAKRSGG